MENASSKKVSSWLYHILLLLIVAGDEQMDIMALGCECSLLEACLSFCLSFCLHWQLNMTKRDEVKPL
jgi:hypothetical protein